MTSLLRSVFLVLCTVGIALCLSSAQLEQLESLINEDSCDFYQELETMNECGETGYVKHFAEKYCLVYLHAREDYNDIKWNNGVRVCLQRAMLTKIRSSPAASCARIQDWGFGSHLNCYMRPIPNSPTVSYCRIPLEDKLRIGWAAKGAIFEQAVRDQFYQMVSTCLGQYDQKIQKDVGIHMRELIKILEW